MDFIHLLQILVLAIVQGAAELLPISSSAHVTVAARLMGYDMGNVFEWTFLLVMLHTGTMASVLIYFWSRWKKMFDQVPAMVVATVCTAVVGYLINQQQLLDSLLVQGTGDAFRLDQTDVKAVRTTHKGKLERPSLIRAMVRSVATADTVPFASRKSRSGALASR